MANVLTPNVMQFLGGVAMVLLGSLVLKQDGNGALVIGGVVAMANAVQSPHNMVKEAKAKRASMAPPAP